MHAYRWSRIVALLAGLFGAVGCDDPFTPIAPTDLQYSIFGFLDASADTQWIRVIPIRPLVPTTADSFGATVTLEHLGSGLTVGSFDIGGFKAGVRWQLGSGLPFTRPLGFDEGFDYGRALDDVHLGPGTTRLLLDRPYTGRLPVMHRLDLSLERSFELPTGRLLAQAGVINAYDRRNMFYYDLFARRRVDQLPLAPYLSFTLRGK